MSRKRRGAPPPGNQAPDGLGNWIDWQKHQYLPGYWVGGKVPPYLPGKRPNKFGYLLLATGIGTFLIVGLRALLSGANADPLEIGYSVLFAALQVGAGVSLLKRS